MSKRPALPTTGAASTKRDGATPPRRTESAPPLPPTAARLPHYARRIAPGAAPGLTSSEWLLADGQGGFAMGSVSGAPTRRYHGWLIAATTPPVGRVSMLACCAEWFVDGESPERRHDLSTFQFPGCRAPRGEERLVRFETGSTAKWLYEIPTSAGTTRVTRELVLARPQEEAHCPLAACVVRYVIENSPRNSRLIVRPLVSMRDFHGLLRGRECPDRFVVVEKDGHVSIDVAARYGPLGPGEGDAASPALNIALGKGDFAGAPQWWYDFEYPVDGSRGQDCHEDLYSPGEFTFAIAGGTRREPVAAELCAWVGGDSPPTTFAAEAASQDARQARLIESVPAQRAGVDADIADSISRLTVAADRYVVRRDDDRARPRTSSVSVIAGYPWFSDWGRDSMISLPGLLLATGRHGEAREALSTFARLCKDGLIPNWFDNAGNAEYNTVDAALWFVHAACLYASAAPEHPILNTEIGRACLEIVAAYRAGTRHGIRMDADGLVTAGDAGTQLTWMDAKRDGVIFTPRYGKPVEVNALWYNALRSIAEVIDRERPEETHDLADLADMVRDSFLAKFWNQLSGCLYDVLVPCHDAWRPDARTRPNQIFAVSLPHSPLSEDQQAGVVECVRRRLLTPVGLRTLSPGDPGYVGRFRGNLFERDRAYHNGTVWPWLLGPFAEATMRIAGFSHESRREAFELLRPLVAELDSPHPGRMLGQLPEVYDGDDRPDEPRQPGGCPAQAWSVAETLRVLCLLHGPTPAELIDQGR